MYALVVVFQLRPDAVAAFDALVDETVHLIRTQEPGTLLYLVHTVTGEPQQRLFYELYADEAAFEAHEHQPHVQAFLAARTAHLAAAPIVTFATPRLESSKFARS
jgi:quinol monooxygenase YgiN